MSPPKTRGDWYELAGCVCTNKNIKKDNEQGKKSVTKSELSEPVKMTMWMLIER